MTCEEKNVERLEVGPTYLSEHGGMQGSEIDQGHMGKEVLTTIFSKFLQAQDDVIFRGGDPGALGNHMGPHSLELIIFVDATWASFDMNGIACKEKRLDRVRRHYERWNYVRFSCTAT